MKVIKKVTRIGNSLGIILDRVLCNGKIKFGDELEIEIIKVIKKEK